jgi:hypothetical protein
LDELAAQLPVQREIVRLERALAAKDRLRLPTPQEIAELIPPELPRLIARFNPVELLTVDDYLGVRDRFLARPENPTFTYENSTRALTTALDDLSIDEVEARLHRIRSDLTPSDGFAGVVKEALEEKIDDELATIELFRGLVAKADARVKQAVQKKYGRVDDALLEAAQRVESYRPPKRSPPKKGAMTAQAFAAGVRWMLERYYAHHPVPEHAKYRVEVDAKYSAIDVRDKSSSGPIIGIPPRTRPRDQARELLRHEIDQHARQSLNGLLMFGFGGGGLKVDEETWYEGLAKVRELEPSPPSPYYVFAIRMADEGKSFVEVFEAIRERAGAAGAWSAAYRVFRGHSDTGNEARFGLPKDQAYLRGWILASQLEARGLSHLLEAAISTPSGIERIARFDFGPSDLLFPDLNLASRYFEEVVERA